MSISVVVLAAAVVGAYLINKMAAALLTHFLPDKWWLKPLRMLVGWGLGVLFIYFAGYYIMSKATPIGMALIVAFTPWVANFVWKIVTKSKMIEG
jgi:hypothetical protein